MKHKNCSSLNLSFFFLPTGRDRRDHRVGAVHSPDHYRRAKVSSRAAGPAGGAGPIRALPRQIIGREKL